MFSSEAKEDIRLTDVLILIVHVCVRAHVHVLSHQEAAAAGTLSVSGGTPFSLADVLNTPTNKRGHHS